MKSPTGRFLTWWHCWSVGLRSCVSEGHTSQSPRGKQLCSLSILVTMRWAALPFGNALPLVTQEPHNRRPQPLKTKSQPECLPLLSSGSLLHNETLSSIKGDFYISISNYSTPVYINYKHLGVRCQLLVDSINSISWHQHVDFSSGSTHAYLIPC